MDIIEALRALFHDLYLGIEVPSLGKFKTKKPQDPRTEEAHQKLRSSKWVLSLINGHLASEWPTNNDGSLHKTVHRPHSLESSRKRLKRKSPDTEDHQGNFNAYRKGRLPPRRLKQSGSGDGCWPQGLPGSQSRTLVTMSSHGTLHGSKGLGLLAAAGSYGLGLAKN